MIFGIGQGFVAHWVQSFQRRGIGSRGGAETRRVREVVDDAMEAFLERGGSEVDEADRYEKDSSGGDRVRTTACCGRGRVFSKDLSSTTTRPSARGRSVSENLPLKTLSSKPHPSYSNRITLLPLDLKSPASPRPEPARLHRPTPACPGPSSM